jgi:hypothetical protein
MAAFEVTTEAIDTQTVAIVTVVSTPKSFFIEIAIAIIVPPNVCSDRLVAYPSVIFQPAVREQLYANH